MIYCVVPEALREQLFDRLTKYYADDPNVTVIVDRRHAARERRQAARAAAEPRRRRRAVVTGDFLPLVTP